MEMQDNNTQKKEISPTEAQTLSFLQMNAAELRQHLENLALENPLMELESLNTQQKYDVRKLYSPDEQNRVYERLDRKDRQDPWNLDAAGSESLSDSLIFQLGGLKLDRRKRRVLEYMILNLEPSGYLKMSSEDIAAATGETPEEIDSLLALLQTLEPDGIGARSLPECLAIQLRKNHPQDKTALAIVTEYLEMLGDDRLPELAQLLDVTPGEILRAARVIRSLNPRPGASFGERRIMQYIRPDLVVVKFSGYYDILVNESLLPPVGFSEEYLEMLQTSDSGEVTSYLKDKKEQLEQTIACLEQRSRILLALGRFIVQKQQPFFQNGPGHLTAFSYTDAASSLSVSEDVIACAARDKFLQCTFGIFPVGYFFAEG